jgi:thioredoxin-related protein
MNGLNKRINLAVNLAIVLAVILIGIVFIRTYLPHLRSGAESRDYRIPAGARVSLPGINWSQNGETLLLVLQKGCRFCKESAPFYQRLAHDMVTKRIVHLVAVLPQEVADSKQYLSDLNVPIVEVRQAGLESLGVQGTPTLILVNGKGEVIESWAGKLPPEKEAELLRRITDGDR